MFKGLVVSASTLLTLLVCVLAGLATLFGLWALDEISLMRDPTYHALIAYLLAFFLVMTCLVWLTVWVIERKLK